MATSSEELYTQAEALKQYVKYFKVDIGNKHPEQKESKIVSENKVNLNQAQNKDDIHDETEEQKLSEAIPSNSTNGNGVDINLNGLNYKDSDFEKY